jgi:uncharacterized protein
MSKYHLRRVDREIKDERILKEILVQSSHIALGMAIGDEPYVVPLNHFYDSGENVVYFHGAGTGKKINFLKRNPHVWGLAVLDHGFDKGQCENLYASVAFSGCVEFVEDREARVRVLRKQIEKESGEVEAMLKRLEAASITPLFESTIVCRVKIDSITGKRSTKWTEDTLLQILGIEH